MKFKIKNFKKNIEPFCNCYYCCISYFLYKNQSKHLQVRESMFDFIRENKELNVNEDEINFNCSENHDKYSINALIKNDFKDSDKPNNIDLDN